MDFDNGLFAFAVPAGWTAEEAEDGTVYVTTAMDAHVWISIQAKGVRFKGQCMDAEAFVRDCFSDAGARPDFVATREADGRFVARWQDSRSHDDTVYLLSHGVVAWAQSVDNMQILVFEGACASVHAGSVASAQARSFAWSAPAEVHFYPWSSGRAD